MNDDFLYRLRTEPPAHFAAALKARLDRAPSRRVQAMRVGLGLLLFGTAFAFVSPTVRHSVLSWIAGYSGLQEVVRVDESLVGAAEVPEPAAPDARNEGERSDQGGARAPEGGAPPRDVASASGAPRESLNAVTGTGGRATAGGMTGQAPGADSGGETGNDDAYTAREMASPTSESGYITTGPLMYEEGTASGAFEIREALFTVMSWSMQPLDDMLRGKRKFDAPVAEASARRLEQLAPLIDDAFALDTRQSGVQSRARDEIWINRQEFTLKAAELTEAAHALRVAVQSNNRLATLREAARVGNACGDCHDAFRQSGNKNVGGERGEAR